MRRRFNWSLALFVCLTLVSCTWPHDPEGTTQAVRGNTLIVGLSENEPWVTRSGDTPGGIEVELIKAFAQQMDAEIEWQWGLTTDHLEALNQFELHLVIGGLTATSPGAGVAGLTQPYYEAPVIVAVPSGVAAPAQLDDTPVAVVRGTALSHYVRDVEAEPVFFSDWQEIDIPAAVPMWRADDWNLELTDHSLHTLQYVMAIPPGENRWLTELETFLQAQPPIDP